MITCSPDSVPAVSYLLSCWIDGNSIQESILDENMLGRTIDEDIHDMHAPQNGHLMIIRPVQSSDAGEWLRIRMELWPDSDEKKEAEEIAHFLAVPPRPLLPTLHAAFVCPKPGDRLCGLVEVSIHRAAPGCQTDRIGYLEAWYVDPDWRGQGMGRALVERAEMWAREQGCREMASDTNPSYPLSSTAHVALGYAEAARYYRKDLQ